MTAERKAPAEYAGARRADESVGARPRPGQMPLVTMAGAIGVILMGIQLWLLTVALDLFLSGKGDQVWQLALVSAAIFLGGLFMLWLLHRHPTLR